MQCAQNVTKPGPQVRKSRDFLTYPGFEGATCARIVATDIEIGVSCV